MALPVPPATLLSGRSYQSGGYNITKLRFRVPLDYEKTTTTTTTTGDNDSRLPQTITVTVRVVTGRATSGDVPKSTDDPAALAAAVGARPVMVYAVGGPGSDNPPTDYPPINDFFLDKGYQVLYMDYRGTGSSMPLRVDRLVRYPGEDVKHDDDDDEKEDGNSGGKPRLQGLRPQQQAALLALCRQDNIVRDHEAVRQTLLGADGRWLLLGQSYGGWVVFTYLSFYGRGLEGAIVTGGVPPVGVHADTVYRALNARVAEACALFYAAYPGYAAKARHVLRWIVRRLRERGPLTMPRGGVLTPERFLTLGRTLGVGDGPAKVAAALDRCVADLAETGTLRPATLAHMETWIRFEERPLYALLQESIYAEADVAAPGPGPGPGPGSAAMWSALRVGRDEMPEKYWWLRAEAWDDDDDHNTWDNDKGPALTLSAEHVYPCHYGAFRALRPLASAADLLARKADWPPLYDAAALRANTVPVAALLFKRDIFVDPALSRRTAAATGRLRLTEDATLMHTALKDVPGEVLPRMWALLEAAKRHNN